MQSAKIFWHGLSIRRKLMIFFSIIVVFMSILNLYTLINAFRYLKIYELDLIKNTLVHDLRTSLSEGNTSIENYLMFSSENYLEEYEKSLPVIWTNWRNVWETCNTNNEIYFQINAVRYALLAYIESGRNAVRYKNSDDTKFVESLFYMRRIYNYMEGYLKNLVQLRLEEGSQLYGVQISKVRNVRFVSFLGIFMFATASLFFVNFFSNYVTRPIRDLASISLKIAGGDLAIPSYSVPNRDEIGILAESFNKMTSNISRMVTKLKDKVEIERKLREDELKIAKMTQSLREAQFLSLQSQISPHFLFNTLNIISRTSMFEKAPDTVVLIDALANILRYTLNKQNKLVPLQEELKILERYMQIQQARYGNRLEFILEDNGQNGNVEIPVFTLQPIVENAVKYGLESKEEGGTIFVSVIGNSTHTSIIIQDTGIGMSEEQLEKLRQNSSGNSYSSSSTGIGIANVRRRLAIAFQGRAEFSINSMSGEGTTITIKVPHKSHV